MGSVLDAGVELEGGHGVAGVGFELHAEEREAGGPRRAFAGFALVRCC